ncbi:MAG: VgrG-related protein [Leptolyngbyaceae bacterium]|nr:VgrG-related protein [Leptolyngbyaceae bacterium]
MCPSRYISEPIIQIDGRTPPDEIMAALLEDLLQLSVEESLHRPGMFTLVVRSPYFPGQAEESNLRDKYESFFKIGQVVKIGFKSSTTESVEFDDQIEGTVIEGEITAMETHFTSGAQAPLIIRGYDVSHRLHRGRHNRSFQNYTDSDIVSEVVQENGIPLGTVDNSGAPHDYVFQSNQTNMEFLRDRAARNGFELFVENGKLSFRKPNVNSTLNLRWLKEISSFQVQVNSAEQVGSVEVRGWDYTKKQPFVATRNSANVLTETDQGRGKESSSAFGGKPSSPTLVVVDQPVFSQKEADTIAQALIDELGSEFIHADAIAQGNPDIRPGKVITLDGMGKYSGDYYITETRHLFIERVYTTEFSVRGLRGGDLLSLLTPPNRPQPGQTLLVGRVTNNNDPQGWGRVRVKFPTLTEEHESNWARIVAPGAGLNRGFDCLPEVDDEVLVAFEHGDIRRPYIIGAVWNGKDKPPEAVQDSVADGKVRLRTFRTRTGHTLQFREEDKGGSKKGVYLDTTGNHHFSLNDSDKFVELKTNGGHTLRNDDANKTISLTSTGDITIKAGGTGTSNKISLNAGEISLTGTQKITLTVGANKVELSMSGITIQAGTTVKIQGGAMTEVKGGIVQVQGGLIKLN